MEIASYAQRNQCIFMFFQILDLLPPNSSITFRSLKKEFQEFHRKFVLAAADKAATNVVVVYKMYDNNTLDENSFDDTCRHRCPMVAKFGVFGGEVNRKLLTLYWLPISDV